MNEFELFTLIYFALDAFYGTEIDDIFIHTVLSDMNPFVWTDEGSADPAMYSEYKEFLNGREISIDNSFEIAREYLKTIDYADVTPALKDVTEEKWLAVCKKYLEEPHKGGLPRKVEIIIRSA